MSVSPAVGSATAIEGRSFTPARKPSGGEERGQSEDTRGQNVEDGGLIDVAARLQELNQAEEESKN